MDLRRGGARGSRGVGGGAEYGGGGGGPELAAGHRLGGAVAGAGHPHDLLDLADRLAHRRPLGFGFLDAAQGLVDVLLQPAQRRRRAQRLVQQLVQPVQVLAPVHRRTMYRPRSSGFFAVITFSSSTPKLYTSLFSVNCCVM